MSEKIKIIRDVQGSILCPKHKIIATSLCLEENCKNQINCFNCNILDKHPHIDNNVPFPMILDANMDSQVFDETSIIVKEKKIDVIKENFAKFKEDISKEIDLLEKIVIKVYRRDYLDVEIVKK